MTYIHLKDIDEEEKKALTELLLIMDRKDDGAYARDHRGFNKDDAPRANDLADYHRAGYDIREERDLTWLKEILFKYWRQLPEDTFDIVYGIGAWQRVSNKCGETNYQTPTRSTYRGEYDDFYDEEFDEDFSEDFSEDSDIPF